MKILTVVGARPQFIKTAVVSRALRAWTGVEEILVHTGQHYDDNMSSVFFDELEIPSPTISLGIGSGSHGAQTGRIMESVENVMQERRPDAVLVYGDTNSTLAGALAAAKLHIPVAHVEAGLRSFNRRMPEELNRVVADHASDILFVPTRKALENIEREGLSKRNVHWVGDVMYDAALFYATKAERVSTVLERLKLKPQHFVLATIHRAENTDSEDVLKAIFGALSRAAESAPVVVPLHPRTRKMLGRMGMLDALSKRLTLIEPVGYLDMVMLERRAKLIVTDSGGVQKEAFFYRVPCLTLRPETEWTELVDSGWNRLVPPIGLSEIAAEVERGLTGWRGAEDALDLFGSGTAAPLLVEILMEFLRSFSRKCNV